MTLTTPTTVHVQPPRIIAFVARLCVIAALMIFIPQANAQTCGSTADIGSETAFNDAIACYNAATSGDYALNLTVDLALSASATIIDNTAGVTMTINGNGNSIDGSASVRIFHVANGNVTIDNMTLQNGYAETAVCNNHLCGGALLIDAGATVAVSNVAFVNNTASDGAGGAILNSGTLTVDRSVFSGNATRYGGAIYNYRSAAMTTVNNSTFSANSAGGRLGTGGAIFHDDGTTTLNHVTITSNDAGRWGAGIYVNDGTTFLNNTIVSGNTDSDGNDTSAKDCAKTSNRGNYSVTTSLDGDGSCGAATQSDQINLGPLQDNGGSTSTHALLIGSDAINAADATVCGLPGIGEVDQRGTVRAQGPVCDIGAFELDDGAPVILVTDVSVEEGIATVDFDAFDVADADGSGLEYQLTGGADQSTLTIDIDTGLLTFPTLLDFEVPSDADQDNYFEFQLTVTDSDGATDTQDIVISVIDVPECSGFPMAAGSWGELHQAISCYNNAVAGDYAINISQSFTHLNAMLNIDNANSTLTINGNGYALHGDDTHRLLDISSGSVTVDNVMLQHGAADTGGAVRVADAAMLTLSNSTVTASNSSSGGGIRNNGTLHMQDSTLSNNTTNRSGEGGGLANYGTANLRGVTVAENAGAFGAALYTRGELTVSNSTISNNQATNLAGAIYVFWTGSATANNTTITGNGADVGGSILNNGGSMKAFNTVIANTIRGEACYGAVRGSSNLVDDDSCGDFTQSDSIELGPLLDNGGRTLTHALLSNSAAIDAGDDAVCAAQDVGNVDQRGNTRPFNLACDIGAFEFVNEAPVLAAIGNQLASEGQVLEFTVYATDMEGGNLTFAIANAPTGAVLIDNGDGTATFQWTPAFNQSGNFADVLITVTDNGLGTQMHSEAITITVGDVNRPPQIASLASQATGEGVMMVFNLLATDPDGNQIALALANAPTGASFTDFGGGSGQFMWTPNYNQSGNYNVMFTATDDGSPAESDMIDVTLTVGDVNRPPALNMIGNRTAEEGTTLSFAVMALDPDGDAISYALANAPQEASLTENTDGSATFSWTPDFGDAGEYTDLLFTITDSGLPAESDSESITVTVGDVNRVPVLDPIGNRAVNEGELLDIVLTGSDPDGDDLSYLVLDNLPQGASFVDNKDGTARFTWMPEFDQAANYSLEFQVYDSGQIVRTASETVTIAVGNVNRLPELNTIGGRTVREGELLDINLNGTDPDGDNLSYPTPADLPQGASFVDNGDGTAEFRWTPLTTGTFQVTFAVGDGSATDTETVTLTVTSAPSSGGGTGTSSGTGSGGGGAAGFVELLLGALILLVLRRRQRRCFVTNWPKVMEYLENCKHGHSA